MVSDNRVRELVERLECRHALQRALAEDRTERQRRLDQALARLGAMPRCFYDDDMSDEFGNPK